VSRHRLARFMCRAQLCAHTRKPFRTCSKASRTAHGVLENLLQQQFMPAAPNRCWDGEITYIRTSTGWRYPSVWIDLYSRRVVGLKVDQRMDAAPVIEALNRALSHRQVKREQLLLHTDQGSQYRATDYGDLLQKYEIVSSMSAKSCSWDSAVVESFLSTRNWYWAWMRIGQC
jgi:putative transposase